MSLDQQILTRLDRLTTEISRMRQEKKKDEKWVSAYWVKDLTGWNEPKLRQARKQGIVTWRRKGKEGVEYLLSSIPPQFIKPS